MSDTLTWLHLSDLHACEGRNGWAAGRVTDTLRAALVRMRDDHGLHPDLIFLRTAVLRVISVVLVMIRRRGGRLARKLPRVISKTASAASSRYTWGSAPASRGRWVAMLGTGLAREVACGMPLTIWLWRRYGRMAARALAAGSAYISPYKR